MFAERAHAARCADGTSVVTIFSPAVLALQLVEHALQVGAAVAGELVVAVRSRPVLPRSGSIRS